MKAEKDTQAPETNREQTAPEQDPSSAGPQPEPGKEKQEKKKSKKNKAEEELAGLKEQLAQKNDQLLRMAAEYENYRKRTDREKQAIYVNATASVIATLLPVVDSLERATQTSTGGLEDFRKGMEMVQTQLKTAFDKLEVEELGKENEPFDPQVHNAVQHIESEEHADNAIVQVFQKGYRIKDKVIRPAMVSVAN